MRRILRLSALALAGVATTTCKLDELVSPQPPGALTASLASVVDSAAAGSRPVRSVAVGLGATGQGALGWSVTPARSSPWLGLSAESGTTPDSLRVSLDPDGLLVGTYQDTLVITQTNGSLEPVRIPVRFAIHPCRDRPVVLGAVPLADSLTQSDCGAPHRAGRFARLFAFNGLAGDSISIVLRSPAFRPYVVLDSVAADNPSPVGLSGACGGDTTAACLRYVLLRRASAFFVEVTSEAAAATGPFTLTVSNPRAPLAPGSPAQLRADSASPVATGGAIPDTAFVVRAAVTDPDAGDSVRLEVEIRPLGTPFTGVATDVGALAETGRTGYVRVLGLADNTSYHWQIRTRDQTGRAGGWVAFGGNNEATPDLAVGVPEGPPPPESLNQLRSNGVTPITLGATTNEATVVFAGVVQDPDPGDMVRLEVEVQPVSTGFTGSPTGSSIPVPAGSTAEATVTGLADNSAFHWRARALDQAGDSSAWISFGENAEGATDFAVAGAAASIAVNAGNAQTATAGSVLPVPPSVIVRDVFSNPVGGVSVTFAVTGGGGTVVPLAPVLTSAAGVAAVTSWTLGLAPGANALSATAAGLAGSPVEFTATATVGGATRLAFVTQPSDVIAGATIVPPVQVAVVDAIGNVVSDATDLVALTFGANAGGGTLSGELSVSAVNGIATFDDLSIDKAGVDYALAATSGSLAGATSNPFTVSPGAVNQLVFTQQPTNVDAGAAIAPAVTVAAQDANGNVVPTYATPIALALGANPGGGALTGGAAAIPASGVATFTGLRVNKVGAGYTLVATSGALNRASQPFDVVAGGAVKLAFLIQPQDQEAGAALAPAVQVVVQDVNGNTVTSSTAAVQLAIGANPGDGILSGDVTVDAVAGIATFGDLSINKVGTGYTLLATSGSLTNATSTAFTIRAAAPDTLVFAVQPTSTNAGATILPPVQVAVRDAFGNTVDTATRAITVAIGTNPASGTLSGTPIRNAVAGVATFNNLSINAAGTGYTLTAVGGGLSTTSAAFDVTVGTGNKLAFVVQPSTVVTGAANAPPIQVAVQDAGNNTVTTATDSITLLLNTNPGGATLSGTLGARAVNGIAVFNDVRLNRAGAGYTLLAFASGLSPATSAGFDITAAATTTTISGHTPDPSFTGQAITVSYTVAVNAPGTGAPQTGTVTVTDGSASCVVAVAAGSCVFAPATAGSKTLTATYSGSTNGSFLASPPSAGVGHTVSPAGTSLVISADAPDPSVTGQTVTVNYELNVLSPGAGTPSGSITVSSGTDSCTGPTIASTGSCALVLTSAGAKTITATYAGDGNFLGDDFSVDHAVNQAATTASISGVTPPASVTGEPVTISFTVAAASPGSGTPTGTVTVSDGTQTCAGALTDGTGSCPIAFSAAGTKSLTAAYAGDANFVVDTSAAVSHTVSAAATTTTILSDAPDPSVVGQLVSIDFSVSAVAPGAGTPTGNVTVSDGSQACNATLVAGVGTCSIAFNSSGEKTLVAAYASDTPGFAGSASIAETHTVNAFSTAEALQAVSSLTPTGTAGGTASPAPTVIVVDAFGNPVPDVSVAFVPGTASGSVSASPVLTGVNGQAVVTWTLGVVAGTQTLTASSGSLVGSPITFSAAATAGVASGATTTIDATPSSITADGSSTSTVTVTVRDGNSNVRTAGGDAVVLNATLGTLGTVTDNANGTYTATLTAGTTTGTATITGTVNALAIADNATVTLTPGAPSGATSTVETTPETITASTGASQATVTVTVRDAGNNPVEGASVSLGTTGTGNTLAQPAGVTNASGQTTGTLSSTVAETKTVTATMNGTVGITDNATVVVEAAAADTLRAVSSLTPSGTVGQAASPAPTVIVVDGFGNARPGVTVTFTPAQGSVSATDVVSGTDGQATVTWTLGTGAGDQTLAVSSGTLVNSPIFFTATASAGAPANMVIQAGDGQIGVVGNAVAAAPAVKVTDTFANPVGGVTVMFSVTGGGGTVTGETPTTGDDGIAVVTGWVVRDTATMSDAGTLPNTVNATSAAGTVTFNASAIYSYATHVQPIWNDNCIGCHGGIAPSLVAPSRENIVDQDASCNASVKRVAVGGGTAAEAASVLMAKMDDLGTISGCTGVMPTGGVLTAATRDIVRAWIRNGAPNN